MMRSTRAAAAGMLYVQQYSGQAKTAGELHSRGQTVLLSTMQDGDSIALQELA